MSDTLRVDTIGESVKVLGARADTPLVAHIPHSSDYIPKDLLPSFLGGEQGIKAENRALVDWYTDELFDFVPGIGGTSLIYQVSRFVCDPERFEDDAEESMSERGMGALYTHGVNRARIREDFAPHEREQLLNRFYRPHHRAFTQAVENSLDRFGTCLILDCHSYPQQALPYELYGQGPRPEICIGADEIHSSEALITCLQESALKAGYEVSINSPFKGSIVPMKFFGDSRIKSLMFEIRRDTYMDEQLIHKSANFSDLKGWLEQVSRELLTELDG